MDWMIKNGGFLHDSVQIAKDDQRGVHFKVKQAWKTGVAKDTHVIKIPVAATMSYLNAVEHPLPPNLQSAGAATCSAHGVRLPREFMDAVGPAETFIFFLIGQYLQGEDGFWFPYIRTLPQPLSLTTPLYYEGDDLGWLKGTSLWPAREQRMELLKEAYENGVRELRKAGFQDVDKYTWDLYLWASSMIVSRAFSPKVLAEAFADIDLPEDGVSVLLPCIDLMNHRPLAKVEWRAGKQDVAYLVLEDVAAGQEIANNYGPRNNEQLMMNYGFCLPDNPCDYRIVSLRAPPGSPLDQARSYQAQMFPEPAKKTEDHYYVFNIFYPLLAPGTAMEHSIFSPALFNAVAVLAANNRELETLEITEHDVRIPESYGSSRTVLAALSQIVIELITHIVKLRASAEGLEKPENLKQIHAKMYRDSQIRISETALVIAAWTLNRARQHGYGGSWAETKQLLSAHMARIPAEKFPEEIRSRIQVRVLERESLLRNNGELFTLKELFDTLPTELQQPCRELFQSVLTKSEKSIPMLRGSSESSPFAFPMFLCFIIAAHTNKSSDQPQLPARLAKWASFILEKYPPPPEDVAWMLEEEDDEQMVSLFDELLDKMRDRSPTVFSNVAQFTGDWQNDNWWLSPNWLRWAWMATEQECVQAPDDPLALLGVAGSGQGKLTLSTVTYLYIPQ
ncbi:SET domain protein [Aspergillus clavatus NRRL 1]|uniref:SET domain protein n=1 Tax=Aspergillus clavatus (strain ATCC 1007 / CBS 513.65 / DSM 816 / NCTC 3887 / NRRL 1 / QM 1276 / 107) TaxID=344612 RepID=A1CI37_ASPCL|nr:SET domain protein [Aspergillus clavatus NRRL 1]EAW10542.1 SET domain protein [Aspergillus clavatus NRRL 1]